MNSRRKGKVGELQAAEFFREHGLTARRGQQFKGGPDSPDVVVDELPGWHVEVKRTEKLQLYEALEQAEEDCEKTKTPVVLHKRNHRRWLVIMDAAVWLKLAKPHN